MRINGDSYSNGPPAVVVGVSVTGLGTVRALAKAGIRVVGVDSQFSQPAGNTRWCEKVSCADINSEDKLVKTLVRIGKENDARAVLFLSTDEAVLIASENRELLSQYYRFNMPSKSDVRTLMDKGQFASFAKTHGFKIPQSFVCNELSDILHAATRIEYPCFLKPVYRSPIWDKNVQAKVFKGFCRQEVVDIYKRYSSFSDRFIVQEIIEGPDSEVYFCLMWYNTLSEMKASFVGRKLIQWPPEEGSTCVAESSDERMVQEESIRVFDSVRYKGIGSVEFKRDRKDGLLKIIEPTVGRADLQSAIAFHAGVNISLMEYCECSGMEFSWGRRRSTRKIYWIHEENLLWTMRKTKKRDHREVVISLILGRKCYALFNICDLRPFVRFASEILRVAMRKSRWRMKEGFGKVQLRNKK